MFIIIYFLFTLSGFIGLIYESTWSRYLKLFLGHSSYGQILTLCIFMGGLGIGAFIASKFSKRIKNPLFAYALLEFLIGLGGLFYHKAFLLITSLFYDISSTYSLHPLLSDIIKVILSALITAPLAILLGMTFPILAVGLMRIVQDRGKGTLSRLYFTNSLGAAIGIMVTSYYFIPDLGTTGSLIIAASGNLIIALCFLVISKRVQGKIASDIFATESSVYVRTNVDSYPQILIAVWIAISFFTGLSSFIYEIGWLRLISMLLGSTTHSFDIMVSAFIFGLAIGGLFAKTILQRYKNIPHALATVQILMGAFAIISIFLSNPFFQLVRHFNDVFLRTETSYYVYTFFKYTLCLLLMFPTSFFAGMTLPLITYFLTNVTRNEKYTGSVYGWNTLGAILGAAFGGLLILPLLQLKFTIAAGAFIDIAIGLLLLEIYKSSKIKLTLAIGFSLLIIVPVFLLQFDSFLLTSGNYRKNYTFDPDEKILVKHGKTSTVSFHEIREFRMIKANGKPEASLSTTEELVNDERPQAAPAFIAMAMMNKPYQAAMIGIGSGMTAHYLLGDPLLVHLDLIEIEREFYNLAKGFLPYNRRVYEDKRINFVFEDARTFFYTGQKKYDIIISEPSNPWVSGVSSLFTEEFYTSINRFLKPDGLIVQWIQLYEFDSSLLLVILKAISNVFPHVKIYDVPGGGNIVIVASQEDFEPKYYRRFETSKEIVGDLKRFSDEIDFFTNSNYILSGESLKPILKDYNPNSDFFPIVDNGAEKAFFLGRSVEILSPFKNSLFYYQEVLEPYLFSKTLKEKLLNQAEFKPDPIKMNYLLTLLKQADINSDWDSIERLLIELIPIEVLRGQWNHLEAVKILRQKVLKKTLPDQIRLKFLFLDYSINDNEKSLKMVMEEIISRFKKDAITSQLLRAMAIQCLKIKNFKLFDAFYNKFVKQNREISKEEKMLLYNLGDRINHKKNEM